jgi:hypothetical protein
MADVLSTSKGPAGGSHRAVAAILILAALILLTLVWVMTKGAHNKVSDRVGTTGETGTAGGVTSGEGQSGGNQSGGNQSTQEGQPITGH